MMKEDQAEPAGPRGEVVLVMALSGAVGFLRQALRLRSEEVQLVDVGDGRDVFGVGWSNPLTPHLARKRFVRGPA